MCSSDHLYCKSPDMVKHFSYFLRWSLWRDSTVPTNGMPTSGNNDITRDHKTSPCISVTVWEIARPFPNPYDPIPPLSHPISSGCPLHLSQYYLTCSGTSPMCASIRVWMYSSYKCLHNTVGSQDSSTIQHNRLIESLKQRTFSI